MREETADAETQLSMEMFPVQLVDVRLYEAKLERLDLDKEEVEKIPLKLNIKTGDEPLNADKFGLLLTFDLTLPIAHIYLAIEGNFTSIVDPETIKPEVIRRFKASDSVVLLWPYLRQTFHDLVTRMRLDVSPLPILDARALVQSPLGEGTFENDAEIRQD
jgi:preprotein translocase subunit SecB